MECKGEMLICSSCNGSGEGRYEGETCTACGGSGEIMNCMDCKDYEECKDERA
jgi:RecJ-like exonuclease